MIEARPNEPAIPEIEAQQTPAETQLLADLNASIRLLAERVGVDLDDQ